MSVINEALKKASQARRSEEPAQVLFDAPPMPAVSAVAAEVPQASAAPALSLFPILLAVVVLLLAGYSAFLYQSRQTEQSLRVAAETRFAEQSELLGQTTQELADTKTNLEDIVRQNVTLQKTVATQQEVIAASVSGQGRLTDKIRTLFKALFASRSKTRQFKSESASKENTIGLLVGELSKSKEAVSAPQN